MFKGKGCCGFGYVLASFLENRDYRWQQFRDFTHKRHILIPAFWLFAL